MQLDSTYNSYLKSKVLSSSETKELLKAYKQGDRKALDKIVQGNQRLILALAKKYTGNGLDYEDLVQEGNIGLLRAIEKFDLTKENTFSTYATEWILQNIKRAIEDKGNMIRVPAHSYQLKKKAMRTKAELSVQLGREATNIEIGEALNIDPTTIYELVRATCDMKSLDEMNTNNQNQEVGCLNDILEDETIIEAFNQVEMSDVRDIIEQALRPFDKRRQEIFKARYGLGQPKKTLREIAEETGITFERVRQLEAHVMKGLKRSTKTLNKLRGCI